jgi:hypothetical protein
MKTVTTVNGKKQKVQAIVRITFTTYYCLSEPIISQAHVEFVGVEIGSINEGVYPQPHEITVSTPFSVEFLEEFS